MADNLELYNRLRKPPDEALKQINAGRLKGMTDINPMWRIKALTEAFGPCGIGWKYVIENRQIIDGANGERSAFVDIELFYKWNGEWSEAVPGTGGAAFVANEKSGPHTSDECFKMALTDAISVAAKALGAAADIYWQKDKTKYDQTELQSVIPLCSDCGKDIKDTNGKNGERITAAQLVQFSRKQYGKALCADCMRAEAEKAKAAKAAAQ